MWLVIIFEGEVVHSQPQAHRLGGPGSSEFNPSSRLFLLLLLLVLVLLLLPRRLVLVLVLNTLQLMWDDRTDTLRIIIVLPIRTLTAPPSSRSHPS
jgi:hypothetical protein